MGLARIGCPRGVDKIQDKSGFCTVLGATDLFTVIPTETVEPRPRINYRVEGPAGAGPSVTS